MSSFHSRTSRTLQPIETRVVLRERLSRLGKSRKSVQHPIPTLDVKVEELVRGDLIPFVSTIVDARLGWGIGAGGYRVYRLSDIPSDLDCLSLPLFVPAAASESTGQSIPYRWLPRRISLVRRKPVDMPATFRDRKAKILQDLSIPDDQYEDLSPKGSVDEGIKDLIAEINGLPDYVTTSSCAGRVAVYLEGAKGAKGGGKWLFTSHDLLEPPVKDGESGLMAMFGLSDEAPSAPLDTEGVRFVHFKSEPMVGGENFLHAHIAPLLSAIAYTRRSSRSCTSSHLPLHQLITQHRPRYKLASESLASIVRRKLKTAVPPAPW